jgi:Peptidase propeptide and YPEB domain
MGRGSEMMARLVRGSAPQPGPPWRRRPTLPPHQNQERTMPATDRPGLDHPLRAALASLPGLAPAFACLCLASPGLAGPAGAHPRPVATAAPVAATAVALPFAAPDPGTSGAWRRTAEEQEADEQADLPPGAKVTREEAAAIAVKVVAGEVTSVDVERKLGKLVFTVEIMTPAGEETDVFVDVHTGEVVGTE